MHSEHLVKFFMLRARLAFAMGVMLVFVALLVVLIFRGSNQVVSYFVNTQAAYEVLDHYEDLSHAAYRHFKQRMDLQLVDNATARGEVEQTREQVHQAIERLRIVVAKLAMVEDGSPLEELSVLSHAAKITSFLQDAIYRLDEAESLRVANRPSESVRLLSSILDEDVDRNFQPLIDAAIANERSNALVARERMAGLLDGMQWTGSIAATSAAVFSAIALSLLLRSIRKPIEALMKGTEEIARGNLGYRITLASKDEFGALAQCFNDMAEGLERHQRELIEASNILEHKVEERTLRLNQALAEQNRMDNARRQFFADISHELRTPLTVIRGEAEVTLRGRDRDADEYKETLHRIRELAVQLNKQVSDLLYLARAETAQLQFENRRVDLTELFTLIAEDIEVLAHAKSIAVYPRSVSESVWVWGDRQRLRQVFGILGENACRYTDANGRIELELTANYESATLTITDNGIGIAPHELDLIFDRYYRCANARGSAEDGTGLGLPVAKTIVKAHGGQISAVSEEGSGTTFIVTLPLLHSGEI